MPPKPEVKSGKMDARKTREPVSNHPIATPATAAESSATQTMNEAQDEGLMAPPPPTPKTNASPTWARPDLPSDSTPSEVLMSTPTRRAPTPTFSIDSEEEEEFITEALTFASPIGIPGSKKGNKRAEFEEILGQISGKQDKGEAIATQEGVRVRASSRAIRKSHRQQPGFNPRTVEWDRHTLSAYTWARTEHGPQRKWVHHLKKADSPACTACTAPAQSGRHVVFECPQF